MSQSPYHASTSAAGTNQTLTLDVSATMANWGPGFDTLGVTLDCKNRFTVYRSDHDAQCLRADSSESVEGLTLINPAESLFFRALNAFYRQLGQPRPTVSVEISVHIPLGRGLGSSSSVIVAGLLAGRALSRVSVSDAELLALATDLEGHPDNVAPALLGGALLCDGLSMYPLPWPERWQVSLVIPPDPLATHQARAIMPAQVPMADAVFNLRKTGLLIHALHTADEDALSAALSDCLHQPYRRPLIAAWPAIETLASQHGAWGMTLSGAGPTLAVWHAENNAPLLSALGDWVGKNPGYRLFSNAVLA